MLQVLEKWTRDSYEKGQIKDASGFDLKDLRQINGMGELLQRLSESDESGKYLYIHPQLLWKGYQARLADDKKTARGHAWNQHPRTIRTPRLSAYLSS